MHKNKIGKHCPRPVRVQIIIYIYNSMQEIQTSSVELLPKRILFNVYNLKITWV